MGLRHFSSLPEHIALWEIEEQEEELFDKISEDPYSLEILKTISNPLKRLQFLAGRLVLHHLLLKMGVKHKGISRTEDKQPILISSGWNCSLSHHQNWAVGIVNSKHQMGIDIETPSEQLLRVMPKYLQDQEMEWVQEDEKRACRLWTAKEAAYKWLSKKDAFLKGNFLMNHETVDQMEIAIHYQGYEGQLKVKTIELPLVNGSGKSPFLSYVVEELQRS